MKYKMLTLILMNVLLFSCGKNHARTQIEPTETSVSSAIIGGKNLSSKNNLSRSIVAIISKNDENEAFCSGTIIGSNIILTAAHCVDDNPKSLKIIFGINIDKTSNDFKRDADKFILQPNWQQHLRSGEADIAIIHFAGNLPPGFSPVKLADEKLQLLNGDKVLVAGFGVTNGKTKSGPGILRKTTTSIIDKFSTTEFVTDGENSSVCFGDSGGPAFIKIKNELIQWGVASSVTNESCNKASIHTAVMPYLSWIKSSMNKLE